MDLNKAIRLAVDTGSVDLGSDRAKKNALSGKGKLIIVAANCEKFFKRDVERYAQLSGIPLVQFAGSSVELGNVCGKPFPVQALTVHEAGNSTILEAVSGTATA